MKVFYKTDTAFQSPDISTCRQPTSLTTSRKS